VERPKSVNETSVELPDDAVKAPKTLHKISPQGPRFARLLDGWELGAITTMMVLAAALLAVPRAAAPGVFPVPLLDTVDVAAARARAERLIERAEREGLPFETRAVGDALRRFGLAVADQGDGGEHLQRLIGERVQLALAAGQHEALLGLRAVQGQLFVRAVREHRFDAPPAAELRALGGELQPAADAAAEATALRLTVTYRNDGAAPALTQRLLQRLAVRDLNLEKADLESVVARIYRREAGASSPSPSPSSSPLGAAS